MISFASCDDSTTSASSYWEKQKDNFKYQNKTEFVSDSALRADLVYLKKISYPLLGKRKTDTVYLYSWQERDKTKNEFTVIEDEGEYGLSIYYLILDKKDSVISSTRIAGKDFEGSYWFNTKGVFTSKDTILTTQSLALGYDSATNREFGAGSSQKMAIEKNGVLAVIVEVEDVPSKNK